MTLYESFTQPICSKFDILRNVTNECVYEWLTESFTQPIHSKELITKGLNQVTVNMSDSYHWFIQPVHSKH